MKENIKKIAFQGAHGAYSDLACKTLYPGVETLPCATFEDAFNAVNNGDTDLAMIPVDNTIAGRVADVHHLLPASDLFIIQEHFQPIRHALLGVKGVTADQLKYVHSHIHALPQCKDMVKRLGLKAHVHADTAGAAEEVAQRQDPEHAAIASTLAAEIYDLDILEEDVQDADHNMTRFLVLSPEPEMPVLQEDLAVITSLLFKVRNIPASLYKALGGFATNGLSLAKLESYVDANFQAALFYCDVEGHPESRHFKLAMEELGFFASDVKFLGSYPAHDFRLTKKRDVSEI